MRLDYDQTKYHRCIVCDIDDTISMTTSRDWENAEPIWPTINKLNKLYEQGWYIVLLTARGQLSCEADTEKADKKYRATIEAWLKKYGVKYHKLSFQKFLAQYYIDDKNLTPEEFVELEIREIKEGWSKSLVEKRGERIFKTFNEREEALNEAKWYSMAAPLINTPKVHNVIGKTLCLEYLYDNGHIFKIEDINKAIETFSMYRTYVPFTQYIDRVFRHCKDNDDFFEIISLLEEKYSYFESYSTFMHGDLSVDNLIQTDKGLFFIDPIWSEKQWSSYLLDISKMMHSYRRHKRMFEYEVFMNGWLKNGHNLDEYALQLLEISQWIRIIKYVPDPGIKKEFHDRCKKMITFIMKKGNLHKDI